MFRNTRGGGRDPLLPTAGGGRNGGGSLYGGMRRGPKPAISKSFVATVAWALVSIFDYSIATMVSRCLFRATRLRAAIVL